MILQVGCLCIFGPLFWYVLRVEKTSSQDVWKPRVKWWLTKKVSLDPYVMVCYKNDHIFPEMAVWVDEHFLPAEHPWKVGHDRFPRKVVVKRKGKFPSKIQPKKLSLGIKQNNLPRWWCFIDPENVYHDIEDVLYLLFAIGSMGRTVYLTYMKTMTF